MENRALVVLFNGNNIPDNIISRIVKEITTRCQADVETTSVYTLNENDIAKTLISNVVNKSNNDDSKFKCKPCDDAIENLAKIVNIDCSVPLFAINLSTRLMTALDRSKTIGCTKNDKILFESFKTLGQGGPRTTSHAENYFYTKEKDEALREIYKRIFDENGKIKE